MVQHLQVYIFFGNKRQSGAPPFRENKSLYRVICLEHIKKEQAVREAVCSAQMEGLRVTAETERRIRKILDGELTVEERVQQLKSNARKRRGLCRTA